MDSEHRHELEENDLAKWLTVKIEEVKPHLPAIVGVILVALVGSIAWSTWKSSASAARADRWRDFSIALEGGQPDLNLLRQASFANPGTAVEEWSDATWADGRLYEASAIYFRNRDAANEAIDEAIEVYERLVKSSDDSIAERATFQLARAYEIQGNLDEAAEQYGRVTGAFAQVAKARVEDLESAKVRADYEWITGTETASASTTIDPLDLQGDVEPDDIALPETEEADTEESLDEMLSGIDEGEAATDEGLEAAAEEPADDEAAESTPDE